MSERSAEKAGTFLENWNARHLDRYADEVLAGEHDGDCEQRERSSLCHCSKRAREAQGKTTLPTIEFPPPVCNGCDRDVEFDGDGFSCDHCKVVWDRHVGEGSAADRFTDDYGPKPFGGEQFGRRLLEVVTPPGSRGDA